MFKSYLKIAIRNLGRQKAYAIINIGGLAIGLAAVLLIGVFVRHELSYDRFHSKADRIFRVRMLVGNSPDPIWPTTMLPVADLMKTQFPEIEEAVRIQGGDERLVQYQDKSVRERRFLNVDPSFFHVFDFKVLEGNPAALQRPYTVAVTPEAGQRYFGEEDPVGKQLIVDGNQPYEVVAVVTPAPANSHFYYDFLASMASGYASGENEDEWHRTAFTYVLLKDDHSASDLEAKLPAFYERFVQAPSGFGAKTSFDLLPLTRIHLYGSGRDLQPQGDIRYVYLFSSIALLILLIACINYMNLATARSARRATEVGIRKVVGAQRRQLVQQFLGESLVFVVLAVPLALTLAQTLLPRFSDLMQRTLTLGIGPGTVLALVGIALVVAGVSGLYPALVLSAYRPASVLKGQTRAAGAARLRKGLVVFQFMASVVLIACTTVILRQLYFVQHTRLGFDKEHVLVVEAHGALKGKAEAFKAELLRNPAVEWVSMAYALPSRPFAMTFLSDSLVETQALPPGVEYVQLEDDWVDYDFISALGLQLVSGRNFSPAFPSDEKSAVLINEAAQHYLGWENAIGKRIGEQAVIGVVRDFHVASMRERIEPLMMHLAPDVSNRAIVRLRPGDLPATLASLKRTWSAFVPAQPFDYTFLDDDFDAMYRDDRRLGQLFAGFSVVAIFVACLGLFGLAAFTAESRTKEIGIRKVLGASVTSIVRLLSKDFLKLVALAFALALPVAYFAMSRWLEDFAYHISIGAGTFALAGGLALLIALCTVSYQAVKAALADPVKSLRYE